MTEKAIEAAQQAYRKHVAAHGVEGSTEAIAAAIAAYEAALWQPIETAPKDRTVALFWNGKVRIGYFDRVDDCFVATVRSPTKTISITDPTHWRHLPTPPKEPGQ